MIDLFQTLERAPADARIIALVRAGERALWYRQERHSTVTGEPADGHAGALRPGGQEPTEEESEAENRIAMRAGVHDLLLDYPGNFPLNFFGDGDVGGLPPGLFQGDNLFAIGALGHAGILSPCDSRGNGDCGLNARDPGAR